MIEIERLDEHGFASLTAIVIVLLLAYLIRGISLVAEDYVDMTRDAELELRLHYAACAAFERVRAEYEGKTVAEVGDFVGSTRSENPPEGVDGVIVNVKKTEASVESLNNYVILITAVAKKNNYFGVGVNAFRSVTGFLRSPKRDNLDGKYKLSGIIFDRAT